jgi:hypothetical protein
VVTDGQGDQATGGIANVLHSSTLSVVFFLSSLSLARERAGADAEAVPYKSQWLTGIGLAFFFLNLCLFTMNCVLISLRFYWRPGSLVDSFTDQFESLFISAIVSHLLLANP